ncbi:hypothetical protein PQI65_15085 [Brachybacterium paraconglomeratum]
MTTLCRPVLIESAEQAEALPEGTLARHDDHMPVEKWRDEYGGTHWGYIEESVEVDLLLGWTALVPIEAEEERQAIAECEIGVPGTERIVHEHRFVTPWEER